MKLLLSLLTVVLSMGPLLAQIPVNSKRFFVDDYFYVNARGNYDRYSTHGFIAQSPSNVAAKVFILPSLGITGDEITYISEDGNTFRPYGSTVARSIIIPVNFEAKLPGSNQYPAIYLADGQPGDNWQILPLMSNPNGTILMSNNPPVPLGPITGQITNNINTAAQEYANHYKTQQDLINNFGSKYDLELVNITELEIEVIIDNEVVSSVSYPGSIVNNSGLLTEIAVVRPSLYQQNRIKGGNFLLSVSYKFRDVNAQYINARFNVRRIINQFVQETQRVARSSSSSGWQIMGFGNRRKRIRTSISYDLQQQMQDRTYEQTVIEMFDASDALLEQFEATFFPSLSRQRVIEGHLAAAEDPTVPSELRALHLRYAEALQVEDPNLEVDVEKAAAALSKKDYAGFLAHGVRMGSSSGSSNSNFRRVVNSQADIEQNQQWTQVRNVSIQHKVTQLVKPHEEDYHEVWLGLSGAIPFNYLDQPNQFSQPVQRTGLVLRGLMTNGPMHSAGMAAGMLVESIEGQRVGTREELLSLLEDYEPGDELDFRVRFMARNNFGQWFVNHQNFRVKTKRGRTRDFDN